MRNAATVAENTPVWMFFHRINGLRRPTGGFETYINEDSVHVSFPTFDHGTVMLVGV